GRATGAPTSTSASRAAARGARRATWDRSSILRPATTARASRATGCTTRASGSTPPPCRSCRSTRPGSRAPPQGSSTPPGTSTGSRSTPRSAPPGRTRPRAPSGASETFGPRGRMSVIPICRYATYDPHGPAAQEGLDRAPRPPPRRAARPPRLRDREAHRDALRRSPASQRRLPLSPPLPAGGARPDRGPLGREALTAPPPLLQPDAGGPPDPAPPEERVG